ncbi:MAG: tyrosine recombinase XerD [Firmicutes bacterium]|nr:tyrosine recombinase XerD [Bacillota bacterium]
MINNVLKLIPIEEEKEVLLGDIIYSLGISNTKEHLSESDYLKIIERYSSTVNKKEQYIDRTMSVYKKTISLFPDLQEWEQIEGTQKIVKIGSKSNIDYYYTMVLSGRMQVDWKILNSYYVMPKILHQEEFDKVNEAIKHFDYKEAIQIHVPQFLQKIMIASVKKFTDISEQDIYKYRDLNSRPEVARATFYVLKRMGNIDVAKEYEYPKTNTPVSTPLKTQNRQILTIYNEYAKYAESEWVESTREKKVAASRFFLNWLSDNLEEINLSTLSFETLISYADYLKEYQNPVTLKPNSKSRVVHILSYLKSFFEFLTRRGLLNDDLVAKLVDYNSVLYYKKYKNKTFPYPVPMKDRIAIEKMVLEGYPSNQIIDCFFRLLYLLGLRPVEALSIKLDCLRGTEKTPMLYIHKGKDYKERFIPLPNEEYLLIKKLQEINKDSMPIYFEYDELTTQRLLNYRGTLIREGSLNDIFKDLQVKHGIVDFRGDAKYTLYILRKIRITTWLENGLSETEVAYLCGHGNVDSHNFYLVGKETRIANAQKVFNQYYKELLEQVEETGSYKPREVNDEEVESYFKQLERTLIQIESKNINLVAMESIVKNVPELLFPVSCGMCFSLAILGDDFECERMKFPCLECDELLDAENHISNFNNYVQRLYKQRQQHEKNGLDGLVERDDSLLGRLKLFYVKKFKMTDKQVEDLFESYKQLSISKRGRKKKVTVEDVR